MVDVAAAKCEAGAWRRGARPLIGGRYAPWWPGAVIGRLSRCLSGELPGQLATLDCLILGQ